MQPVPGTLADTAPTRVLRRIGSFFAANWLGRILAALVFLAINWVAATGGTGHLVGHLDMEIYRDGAKAFLDGTQLYGVGLPTTFGINLPFIYPPMAAILFIGFAKLSVPMAGLVITVLNLVLIWFIVERILSATAGALARAQRVWLALALGCVFACVEPSVQTLGFGQINIVVMALVVADLMITAPRWPRGVLIGLAIAIKVTPAVFGLMFLVKKDWKALGTLIAATIGWNGIAWIIDPKNSAQFFFHELPAGMNFGDTLAYGGNVSLRSVVARFYHQGTTQSVLWAILVLIALGLTVWALRRCFTVAGGATWLQMITAGTVTGIFGLLASPISWSHHWVWLIPVIMLSAYAYVEHRSRAGLIMALIGFFITVVVKFQWIWPKGDGQEFHWPFYAKILGNAYCWYGVAFIVIVALVPQLFVSRKAAQEN